MKTTIASMRTWRRFSISISSILLLSLTLPQAPARPASARANQAMLSPAVAQDHNMGLGQATSPLGSMLNPDGTLDLQRGFSGSLDARGWQMVSGPGMPPRFVRNNTRPDTSAECSGRAGGAASGLQPSQSPQSQDASPPPLVPGDENWDGTFGIPNVNNIVIAVAVSGNGEAYIGGNFTTAGGSTANRIVKWNRDGWSALGSGMNGYVEAIAVSGNGDVYAGGYFTTAGGVSANHIARWNGSAWSALGSGVDNVVHAIAVSGNGDVYAGGYFTTAGGVTVNNIAKWNGSAWSALGSGMNSYVDAIAVSGNGALYAGGDFTTADGVSANHIARWSGGTWSAIGSGVNGTVYAIAVNSATGDVYVGGDFTTAGGVSANHIAKWNGSAWSALGSGTSAYVDTVAVNSATSEVYVGGPFTIAGGKVSNYFGIWHNPAGPTPSPTPTRTPLPTQTPGGPTATPAATSCPIQFTDVPIGSTFYDFVRCLACRGIINGYADGTFKPNNLVTRGQLSKIVSNAAAFSDPQPNQIFEDVPLGSTFHDFIGRLASRGYINGYSCGGDGEPCVPPNNLPYFRPNNNATRGQIAKIDANSAGFSDPPVGQTFEDVAPASAFYTYTQRLTSRAIMGGYPCGGAGEPCVPPDNRPYFRPNNNATRGQTSKIISGTFYPDCQTPSRR